MGVGDLDDGLTDDGAAALEDGAAALLAGEHALLVDGDPWTARGHFAAAYDQAERGGDPYLLARAALGLGGLWAQEQRTVADAAATRTRQRAALRRLDPRSVLALRLRIRLTAERAYRTGDPAAILAQVAEARGTGDGVAKVEALTLAHYCSMGPGHGPLRLELAQELIGEASRTGRPGDLLVGLLLHTVDLFLDAHPHAARSLAELREHLASHEHRAVRAMVEVLEVMLGIRAGRLEAAGAAADAWAGTWAERGATAAGTNARAWYGGQLGTIRWFQGRIADLRPMLLDLVDSPTLSETDYSTYASLALAAASAGDRPLATSMLARLRGRGLAALPQAASWLLTMYCVVETAWLLKDPVTAAEAAALLEPHARLPVIAGHGITCLGSVHHCLGTAALATGDADAAAGHLRAAVRDNMSLGHRPATALSRARLARALALPGRSQDPAAADAELVLAAKEAAELHMPPPSGIERGTVRLRDDAGQPDQGMPVVCRRRGRRWDIEMGGRAATVDHCVGLEHLAVLTANPGREIPAAELAAGHGGQDAPSPATAGQPLLDEAAKRQYKRRLAELQDQADRAGLAGAPDRAAELLRERDWLIAELASATGLGGRTRRFADNDERARIAVGKAIRRALDRIADADPVIGAELRAHVRTGQRCCYLAPRTPRPSQRTSAPPAGSSSSDVGHYPVGGQTLDLCEPAFGDRHRPSPS
ncbi:MAG TPA: hypothetical protein VFV01_41415 [Spirillospora sp.]|nr:hypothetical protein [Spirillospora sp.]